MKVVFKLNEQQHHRAVETMNFAVINPEGDDDFFFAGNVRGWLTEYAVTNTNNQLDYDVEKQELTYSGHRSPLLYDGTLDIMKRILGIHWSTHKPMLYETSDIRLKWWEDLYTYINNRAPFPDWYKYCIQKNKTFAFKDDVPSRFVTIKKVIGDIIDKKHIRKLYDIYPASVVDRAKKLVDPIYLEK